MDGYQLPVKKAMSCKKLVKIILKNLTDRLIPKFNKKLKRMFLLPIIECKFFINNINSK